MTIAFTVDLPPSVNRVWRHSGKRVYRDRRYIAWQRTAGWEVMAKRPGRFPTGAKVAMTIRAGKPKRARDIDNLGKALLDLMQAVGIVDNDRNVTDLHLAWDDGIEPNRCSVEIREVVRRTAA